MVFAKNLRNLIGIYGKNESDAIRIRNQIRGGRKFLIDLRLLSLISKAFMIFGKELNMDTKDCLYLRMRYL